MPDDPVTLSISSNPSTNPDEIARKQFPSARRGVDGDAVRRYLEGLAQDVRDLLERETMLRRALSDAERRAAEPELDEATLMRAVGSETARILQTAHDAARDVVSRAEESSAAMLAEADGVLAERTAAAAEKAEAILATAEEQAALLAAEAGEDATELLERAQREAEELSELGREEAASLLDATKRECRQVIRQARELRKRVLDDLSQQRHGLYVQLEQLRTGRDVLLEVVDGVAVAVEDVRARLAEAEHDARVAAAEAGARAESESFEDEELELGEGMLTLIGNLEDGTDEGELEEAGEVGRGLARAVAGAEAAAELDDAELALELAVDEGLAGELVDEDMTAERAEDEAADEAEKAEELAAEGAVVELAAELAGAELAVEELVEAELAESDETERELVEAELAVAEAVREAVSEELTEAGARDDARVGGGPHRNVDELFARIRASRAAEVAEAEAVIGAHDAGAATKPEPVSAHQAAVEEPEVTPSDEEIGAHPEHSLDPDAAAIARRTEVMAPLLTRLSRSLKRALQDDQNELLDAIRHSSGQPELDKLLPLERQRERLGQAGALLLAECWLAGRPWLRPGSDSDEGGVVDSAADIGTALASDLAEELTGLLRHRLTESLGNLTDLSDGGQDAAGAAYREWKGPRIEALAGDFALRAFSSGAIAGAAGTAIRWVMDDDGQPCPDCDDNALAGEQPAGEPFPTGQTHPPVHAGCRCLIVAVEG